MVALCQFQLGRVLLKEEEAAPTLGLMMDHAVSHTLHLQHQISQLERVNSRLTQERMAALAKLEQSTLTKEEVSPTVVTSDTNCTCRWSETSTANSNWFLMRRKTRSGGSWMVMHQLKTHTHMVLLKKKAGQLRDLPWLLLHLKRGNQVSLSSHTLRTLCACTQPCLVKQMRWSLHQPGGEKGRQHTGQQLISPSHPLSLPLTLLPRTQQTLALALTEMICCICSKLCLSVQY